MSWNKTITLAITGASGVQYSLCLLRQLVAAKCRIYLLVSAAAEVVINTETKFSLPDNFEQQWDFFTDYADTDRRQLQMFSKEDWFAPVASGSSSPSSMVICPASGGTISAIAHGASNNLVERAADVVLKERRRLIVVPRETPVSNIHLENMLKLSQLGAVVLPASPGFYKQPQSVADLVDFIVARIMDQLGLEQNLLQRWGQID